MKRHEIVVKARTLLAAQGGNTLSFRQLATGAGVSVATMRHYFGSRNGLIEAVMSDWNLEGQQHLAVAKMAQGPLAASIHAVLSYTAGGFVHSALGRVHVVGLSTGLGHAELGPSYLNQLLEPTLSAFEQRLAVHQSRGEIRADADLRAGAIMLVAPLLIALLHQTQLGGNQVRPLDTEAFISELVRAFLCAYATIPESKRRSASK